MTRLLFIPLIPVIAIAAVLFYAVGLVLVVFAPHVLEGER